MIKVSAIVTIHILFLSAVGIFGNNNLFFTPPTDKALSDLIEMNIKMLSNTEMQLVTYDRDITLLPHFWHSIELFVPALKGIVVIYGDEDTQLSASIPPPSYPFPIRTFSVPLNHPLRLRNARVKKGEEGCVVIKEKDRMRHLHIGYQQQQIWNFYADFFSGFDSEFVLLLDSDSVFTSFEYLAGGLFNASGFPSYNQPIDYSFWGEGKKNVLKRLYKPAIDSLLGVNNRYEFMLQLPFVFRRSVFKEFRDKVVDTLAVHPDYVSPLETVLHTVFTASRGAENSKLPRYPNFMDAMQDIFVDKRRCKNSYHAARVRYGFMSNFDLLIAYVFYFQSSTAYFKKPSDGSIKGFDHLGQLKQTSVNWEYVKNYTAIIRRNIGCSQWYCYNRPVPSDYPAFNVSIP